MKNIIRTAASVLTLAAAAFAGVTASSPTNGSTTGSSVRMVATGSISGTPTGIQVYVDGQLKGQQGGSYIDTYVSLANGWHNAVYKQWNNYGQSVMSSNISFYVNGTTSTSSSNATYGNIDQIAGWASCDACAGPGGSGPAVPYSTTQGLSSPSIDGKSQTFWVGGSTPYSQALWWKQLGANSNASHFVYDLYFYYNNASAPQALEFDVNQSVGGKKYIFGTQCNIRGDKTWDYWDNNNQRWATTGVACPAPPVNTWNHLVWEFERVNGQVHYISVTLNGVKSYVNKYTWPLNSGVNELNVAFQMDKNYASTTYNVWLDKVNLTAY